MCDVTRVQGLYDNRAGAADSLARVWAVIAAEFRHKENILGYNLLNEPWAGHVYKVSPARVTCIWYLLCTGRQPHPAGRGWAP